MSPRRPRLPLKLILLLSLLFGFLVARPKNGPHTAQELPKALGNNERICQGCVFRNSSFAKTVQRNGMNTSPFIPIAKQTQRTTASIDSNPSEALRQDHKI